LFRSAVPVSRTSFRSTGTSTAQENNRFEKKAFIFLRRFRSSSSHGHFLRSVGLLHPQYRFISLRSIVRFPLHCIPLQALSFSSLHSSSIMSAALRVFSGCSFAQPLGLAPLALCPKSRNAIADLYFFPTVSRSQYYSPLRKGYVPFPSCGGCSIAATPPLRSSQKKFRKNSIFFTAVLGGVL
jgi:hypothetical protein